MPDNKLTYDAIQAVRQSEGLVDPTTGLQGGASTKGASPLTIEDVEVARLNAKYGKNDAYLGEGDFGLDPSEYDFQLRYGADNDEIRAKSQSNAGMMLKGAGRLGLTTLTKFLAGIGYAGTAIPAIITGDMNTMLDNGMSAYFNNLEEEVKEALPIYKTQKYLNGDVFEQMGTLGFWTDDVVDGAAFMLSSIIGSKGIGAAGKSLGAYSKIAKNASRAMAAARAGHKVGREAIQLKKIADSMTLGTMTAFNTVSESAFEAKDIKDQIMNKYALDVEAGRMTAEEANQRASHAASTTFWTNMALLGPSNHLSTNLLFKNYDKLGINKVFGKGTNKTLKELAEEVPETLTRKQALQTFGAKSIQSALSEGAYEENLQHALQTYVMARDGGKDNRSLVEGLLNNAIDNFSDREGQKAIALGSIIGLIPGGIGGVRQAQAEQRERHAVTQARGKMINMLKENGGVDIYQRAPIFDEKGEIVSHEGDLMFGADNKPIIDQTKVAAIFDKAYTNNASFIEAMKANASGNKHMYDAIRNDQFSELVFQSLLTGAGVDGATDIVDMYAQGELETRQQLAQAEGKEIEEDEKMQIAQLRETYHKRAKQLSKVYDSIMNNYAGFMEFGKDEKAELFKNGLISRQFRNASDQLFWDQKKKELQRRVAEEPVKLEETPLDGMKGFQGEYEQNRKQWEADKKALTEIEAIQKKLSKQMKELVSMDAMTKEFGEFKEALEVMSEGRGVADSKESDTSTIRTKALQEANTIKSMDSEKAKELGYTEDAERAEMVNSRTGAVGAAYYYRTDPDTGMVHILHTNPQKEGEVIGEKHVFTEAVSKRNLLGQEIEGTDSNAVITFVNGKIDKVGIRDLETGELREIPRERFVKETGFLPRVTDLDLVKRKLQSLTGYKFAKNPVRSISPKHTAIEGGAKKIDQKTLSQHRDDIRSEIETGVTETIEKIDSRVATREKQGPVDRRNPNELMKEFRDRRYDQTTPAEHFEQAQLRTIPAIYQGKPGYLEVENGQMLFTPAVHGEKQHIVSGVSSRETFETLGVTVLQNVTTDVTIEQDNRAFPIRIQGQYFRNPFYGNPDNAILTDTNGYPKAVVLMNTKGQKVTFTTPHIVDDIAFTMELQESLRDQLFQAAAVGQYSDAVIATDPATGVDFAVYRMEDGYKVYRTFKGKRGKPIKESSKIYERVVKALEQDITQALDKYFKEHSTSKLEANEFRRYLNFIREATPEEALQLPDQREVPNPEGRAQEKPKVKGEDKTSEKEIVKEQNKEAAIEEEAAERKETQDAETKEATSVDDLINEPSNIEVLSAEEIEALDKQKAEEQGEFMGIHNPGTAVAYVHYDRDNKLHIVNNEGFHQHIINRPEFTDDMFDAIIDWDYRAFWDNHRDLEDFIKAGKIKESHFKRFFDDKHDPIQYDEAVKTGRKYNLVDTIPIKLVYKKGRVSFDKGIHMHETGYPFITLPAAVTKIQNQAERFEATKKYIKKVQETTRMRRADILKHLLVGDEVSIPIASKNMGKPNNVGKIQTLRSLLAKLNNKMDLNTVDLGIALEDGAVYTQKGQTDSLDKGTKGGLYLFTNYTADGTRGHFKVSPAKISREHGEVILKAFQQAAVNGLEAKYVGEEVTGGLTNAQVLGLLVRQGKKYTAIDKNDVARQHLVSKQLWAAKEHIIFGNKSMPLHPSQELKEAFLDWITQNKNYSIQFDLLKKPIGSAERFEGVKKFSIGNFAYDAKTDNYNKAVIEGGFIQTDLDIVKGTKSITKHPVIEMNSTDIYTSAGLTKTREAIAKPKVRVAPEKHKQAVKPKQAEPAKPTAATQQTISNQNTIAAQPVKQRKLGVFSKNFPLLRDGAIVYFANPRNKKAGKYPFGTIKDGKFVATDTLFTGDLKDINKFVKLYNGVALSNTAAIKKFEEEIYHVTGYLYYDMPGTTPAKAKEEEKKAQEVEKQTPPPAPKPAPKPATVESVTREQVEALPRLQTLQGEISDDYDATQEKIKADAAARTKDITVPKGFTLDGFILRNSEGENVSGQGEQILGEKKMSELRKLNDLHKAERLRLLDEHTKFERGKNKEIYDLMTTPAGFDLLDAWNRGEVEEEWITGEKAETTEDGGEFHRTVFRPDPATGYEEELLQGTSVEDVALQTEEFIRAYREGREFNPEDLEETTAEQIANAQALTADIEGGARPEEKKEAPTTAEAKKIENGVEVNGYKVVLNEVDSGWGTAYKVTINDGQITEEDESGLQDVNEAMKSLLGVPSFFKEDDGDLLTDPTNEGREALQKYLKGAPVEKAPEVTETPTPAAEEEGELEIKVDDGVASTGYNPDQKRHSVNNSRFNPFRMKTKKGDYIKADIKRAQKWLRKRLGKHFRIELIDGLIELGQDRHAFGQARWDSIRLSKIAEVGTEYHEAFHRVSLFLLTEEQRRAYYQEARRKYNMQNATNEQIEEHLAEEFRSYVMKKYENKPTTVKGKIKEFFQRIWDYIMSVFVGPGKLRTSDIEGLFSKVEKGRFQFKRPDRNRLHELRGRYANFELRGTKFDNIQTDAQFREVIQNMFYLMAQSSGIISYKEGDMDLLISEAADLNKLSYQSLLKEMKAHRDNAANLTTQFENDLANIKAAKGRIPAAYLAQIKHDLGNSKLPTAAVVSELEHQIGHQRSITDLFGELLDSKKFDLLSEQLEDFMLSLNIVKKTEKTDIDLEEKPDEDTGETGSDFDRYDKVSFESSAKHNTAANIKLLMSILPESTELSELTGLPKFAEFGTMWSRILRDATNITNVEDMMDILEQKSAGNLPYQILLRHLKGDENLKTQFYRTLSKTRLDFINAYLELDEKKNVFNLTFGDTAIQSMTRTLVKDWNTSFTNSNKLFTHTKEAEPTPNKEAFDELHKRYNTLLEEIRADLKQGGLEMYDFYKREAYELLNAVGIGLNETEFGVVLEELGENDDQRLYNFIKDHMTYILGNTGTLYKLFNGIKAGRGVDFANAFSNERSIEYIAQRAAYADPSAMGDSVLGAKGNRYYLVSQHTYLTNEIERYKKDTAGMVEQKLKAVYNKNSLYLNHLKNNPEDMQKFSLKTLAAIIRKDSGDRGREYQKVTDLEEYLIRLSANHKGYTTPPTPADRKFFQYLKGLPTLTLRFDKDGNYNEQILKVFRGYLQDEINRVELTKEQVDKAIAGEFPIRNLVENLHFEVPKKIGKGHVVEAGEVFIDRVKVKGEWIYKVKKEGDTLESNDIKQLYDEDGYTGTGTRLYYFSGLNDIIDDLHEDNYDEHITAALNKRLEDELNYAEELGIIAKDEANNYVNKLIPNEIIRDNAGRTGIDSGTLTIKNAIADSMVNTMMGNIEMSKMFTVDPATYKHADDLVKRLTGYTSTGDNLRTNYPKGVWKDDELVTADKYNVTTFTSHIMQSKDYETVVQEHIKWYMEFDLASNEVEAEKIARKKLGNLLKVDQTDAQTFISNEMYRALGIKLGEWSQAKEKAYQILTTKDITTFEDMVKKLTPAERVEVNNMISQPFKMTYVKTYQDFGQSYGVFDKMSMATLFRPMVAGTQLEELLDRMEAKGKYEGMDKIHQVKFNTAEKSGIKDRRRFFADETEKTLTDLKSVETYEQDFEYLRMQLVTDPHDVKTTMLGSQMKKMGIADVIMHMDYQNFFDKNETLTGEELVEQVHAAIGELSNRGAEDFMDELNLTNNFMVKDKKALVDKLRDEAKRANLPDYVVEAFKLDENGDFYIDFDSIPGARKWTQTRLISLIKKATVDLNLPGNVFIQMTNVGLRKASFSDDLQFFTEEGLIECKVSVNLFKHVIPNFELKSHSERVQFLKDNPELTAMGYRVPTQGQNSTYMLKIKDFLPENTGDTVVLPAEGTAIGGFDFDIDKMYIVRHNYKGGKRIQYLTKENSTPEERARAYAKEEALRKDIKNLWLMSMRENKAELKTLEELKVMTLEELEEHAKTLDKETRIANSEMINDMIDSWVSDNLAWFEKQDLIKQNTTAAVQNRLLDMYFSVWTSRQHYARRTQPLGYGADQLAELSREIRKLEGWVEEGGESLQTVAPKYQLDIKSRFKFGGSGLGPYALANVHQILGQYVGLGLHNYIGVGNYTEVDGKKVTDFSQLLGSKSEDPFYATSRPQEYILEWFSALVDAHVDIAADPYIYYLNANEYTGNVITLLLRAGVDGNAVFKFISQPILKQISKAVENKDNKLNVKVGNPVTKAREEIMSAYKQLTGKEIPETTGSKAVQKIFSDEGALTASHAMVGKMKKTNTDYLSYGDKAEMLNYLQTQIDVINAFEYLEYSGTKLKEAILSSRVDTKKFGNTIIQILAYETRSNKAISDELAGYGIRNYKALYDKTYLGDMTTNAIEMSKNVTGSVLLEGKKAFRNLHAYVLDSIGRRFNANEEVINAISDEVYVNIAADFFTKTRDNKPALATTDKVKELLKGSNSIPKVIYDIRRGDKFPELKDNALIRLLSPVFKQNEPDFLAPAKPDDKWHKDSLNRAWKEMHESDNDAIKQFAQDLFIYSYLTTGFKNTAFSFHDLAPREMYIELGYDKYIKQLKQEMETDEMALVDFTDEIFLNAWNNDHIVPEIEFADIYTRAFSDTVITLNDAMTEKTYIGQNRHKQNLHKPYLKTVNFKGDQVEGFLLYRFAGTTASGQALYYQVDKKSYFKKGQVLRENGLPETTFGSNRINLPADAKHVKSYLNMNLNGTANNLEKLLKTKKKGEYTRPDLQDTELVDDDARVATTYAENVDVIPSDEMAKLYAVNPLAQYGLSTEDVNTIDTVEGDSMIATDLKTGYYTTPSGRLRFVENLGKIEGESGWMIRIENIANSPTYQQRRKKIEECINY